MTKPICKTYFPLDLSQMSKEAKDKLIANLPGEPVWDDIKKKERQIGTVIKAEYIEEQDAIMLTLELDITMSIPTGAVSIGGYKK